MGSDDFFKKKRAKREARKHDQRNVAPNSYLIVSEGTKTEKLYFEGLSTYIKTHFGGSIDVIAPNITVEGIGKGTCSLVNETEKIVNRSPKIYENIWVVFDKDDFPDFDEAIALAISKQFKVAWSNAVNVLYTSPLPYCFQISIIVFSSSYSCAFRYHVEREIPICFAAFAADNFPSFTSR